jgi:hypothetical protein
MSRAKSTHASVSQLPWACLAADPNETYDQFAIQKVVVIHEPKASQQYEQGGH